MLKLGEKLKEKYKNMYHITFFAHLIHNSALKIKTFFKDVDALISSVKKHIIKSSERQKLFENSFIPLPPEPIVTRWNSWLVAVEYYYNYLPQVKKIVQNLKEGGIMIHDAKTACDSHIIFTDIIYIQNNYKFLI